MSVEEKRTAMLGIFHETVSSCASVGRGGCVRTLWYLFSRVGPAARASLQKEAFTLKELEKLGTKAGVGASRALLCRASCPSPESTFNELSSSFHGTFALSCRCCDILLIFTCQFGVMSVVSGHCVCFLRRERMRPAFEPLRARACAVTQTIKDIVQSLVDDSLVEMEKIGSSNYFWSFPSKTLCLVRGRLSTRCSPCPRPSGINFCVYFILIHVFLFYL